MRRFSCGNIIPSECVPYTGKKLSFLTDDEQPDCDSNINDVFDEISNALDTLKKAIDLSTLNKQCLTIPVGTDVKGLAQIQIDKLCGIQSELDGLKEMVNESSIGESLITIDLQCLSTSASSCQTATNTYKLVSVLTLLTSEICKIKQYLAI